jgi:hypothetical protein
MRHKTYEISWSKVIATLRPTKSNKLAKTWMVIYRIAKKHLSQIKYCKLISSLIETPTFTIQMIVLSTTSNCSSIVTMNQRNAYIYSASISTPWFLTRLLLFQSLTSLCLHGWLNFLLTIEFSMWSRMLNWDLISPFYFMI